MGRRAFATAGQVRRQGAPGMGVTQRPARFEPWGRSAAALCLVAAVAFPHVTVPGLATYLVALAFTVPALALVWTHLDRAVRGESVLWGLALAATFFGVTDGVGMPNRAAGPLLLLLALLASSHTFRAWPSHAEAPTWSDRASGLLTLLSVLWLAILAVRSLQWLGGA